MQRCVSEGGSCSDGASGVCERNLCLAWLSHGKHYDVDCVLVSKVSAKMGQVGGTSCSIVVPIYRTE